MSFVLRRPVGSDFTINDLGLTINSGEERDLREGNDFTTDEISASADLAAALTAGDVQRLDALGGSVIPPSQAFDDLSVEAHIVDPVAHGLMIPVLANISDSGSGQVIATAERGKLSGIEAGAEVNDTGAEIVTKLQGEPAPLGLDVATVDGATPANLRDRATHTGTQAAATISDFDAAADARITLQKGANNGLAELDANGRVPASQLTVSAFEFKGNWDANANSPTLASGVGTQGDVYRVSVAGTTNLDGITDWQVGDQALFDGSVWVKQDGTDAVTSVNGQVGAVVLDTDDVGEGASLYFTDGRVAAAPAVVANTAKVSADGSIDTHSDVDLTTPPTLNQLLGWTGSFFAPVDPGEAASLLGFQARQTVALDLPGATFTSVDFDTIDLSGDSNVIDRDPVNTERILFKEPGTYWCIHSTAMTIGTGATGQIRALLNGGTVVGGTLKDIDGAIGTIKASFTTPFLVTTTVANEYVEIQGSETAGDITFDSTLIQVIALRAAKGDPGVPGSGSTINVEGDGVLVPNSPFSILNFIGFDSVVDAGGGQVDITAPVGGGGFGYVYYGKSANQSFSSEVTINFDRLKRDSAGADMTVATVGGGTEIEFNFNGWTQISVDAGIDNISGSRENGLIFIQVDTGGGFVTLDDTDAYGYHRQTSQGEDSYSIQEFPLQVSVGDKIRVRALDLTGATLNLLANACRLKVEREE
jgi:hypothetical protein